MSRIGILGRDDEEGRVFARMLQLSLCEYGYGIASDAFSDPDCFLIDTDRDGYEKEAELCSTRSIPCLFYGKQPIETLGERMLLRPFSIACLVGKIEDVLCKFPTGENENETKKTLLVLGKKASDATYRSHPLHLAPKEYRLLCALALAKGEALTRQELYRRVWQEDGESGSNVVDACIHSLRKKLDERFCVRMIRSVRGVGYRLILQGEEEIV